MKNFWKNLKLVWKYSKDQKGKIVLYGITHIITVILGIIVPILSAKIIIHLTSSEFQQLVYMAMILFIIDVCYNITNYIQRYTTQQIFLKSYINIQTSLGKEILKIENDCLDKEGTGVFQQRITSDTHRLSDMFNTLIFLLSRIIRNIGIFVAIFVVNRIAFAYLVVTTIILFAIEQKRSKEFNVKDKQYRKMQEKNTSFIVEMIRGARDVKMLNAEKSFLKKYKASVETANEYKYEMSEVDRKWSFMEGIFSSIFDFAMILLLVLLITRHNLTVASALIIHNYSSRIGNIIPDIGILLDRMKDFNLSCDRVFAILEGKDYKKEKFGKTHLDKVKGNFEFKEVSFAYEGSKEVLKDLSFKIKANETVAFVGKSGAGKTTIFNLLCKMYEPTKGTITIDGKDIKELDKDSIRGNITIISQSPYIFNLSIKENLKIVKEDATDEEIENACKAACLDEFINALPDKYDTIVGEGGVTLSGGQKQRLAIARALIQKTEIILFDEATSALDNVTQERIQQAIENMKSKYTILMIAHRLSTIINSDRILYLEDGKIVAEGTHEELLKQSKEYKKLYEKEIKE
ncbi:MAG: ABC transporter ATP-binding protein [Bacilli bacterium]|nr:ABC transporter ATP-binding protein [Bacilli bacterium]